MNYEIKTVVSVLALVLVWTGLAFAGLPCRLTDGDYRSLAAAPEAWNRERIEGLSDRDKKELCSTRKLLERVRRSKDPKALAEEIPLDDIPDRPSRFLAPDEADAVGDLVAEIMANAMLRQGRFGAYTSAAPEPRGRGQERAR
jgi:hypothetical protein